MKVSNDNIVLYWAKFSDLSEYKDALLHYLTDSEKKKFEGYTNTKAANRGIISRASLRIVLGKYFGLHPKKVEISYGLHGKPFLCTEKESSINFNVSHSSEILIMAFAINRIGIDIESYDRKVNYQQIMSRFFSNTEILSWTKYKMNSPKDCFLLGWTRKEALLKATGDGISGIKNAEISFSTEHGPIFSKFKNMQWFVYDFKAIPNHIVSLASESSKIKIDDKCLKETLLVDLNLKQI